MTSVAVSFRVSSSAIDASWERPASGCSLGAFDAACISQQRFLRLGAFLRIVPADRGPPWRVAWPQGQCRLRAAIPCGMGRFRHAGRYSRSNQFWQLNCKIFPGFRIHSGSSAFLTIVMTAISSGDRESPSFPPFSRPIPCSAETEPR